MSTVIISRHAGAVEWLKLRAIEGDVIEHATIDDVRGKHVVGNLPLALASYAASVTAIEMPLLKPEQRGKDLTPAEMDEAGACLRTFHVHEQVAPMVLMRGASYTFSSQENPIIREFSNRMETDEHGQWMTLLSKAFPTVPFLYYTEWDGQPRAHYLIDGVAHEAHVAAEVSRPPVEVE